MTQAGRELRLHVRQANGRCPLTAGYDYRATAFQYLGYFSIISKQFR